MMTSRGDVLADFRAKFVATIGTAGSKEGMLLSEACANFSKDWKPVEKIMRELGHNCLEGLLGELYDVVEIRGGRVYPVVNSGNSHVFELIDRTRKKKKAKRSKSHCVRLPAVPSPRKLHMSQRAAWDKGFPTHRFPRFASSTPLGKISSFPTTMAQLDRMAATSNTTKTTFSEYTRPAMVTFDPTKPPPTATCCRTDLKPSTFPSFPSSSRLHNRLTFSSAATRSRTTEAAPPTFSTSDANEHLKKTHAPAMVQKTSGDAVKRNHTTVDKLRTSYLTPTKSPPAKTNVFNQGFQNSGLFRSQLLQIVKVTASSPVSQNSRNIDTVKEDVRKLVAIIFNAGRSITLEELKKKYYEINHIDLTGVKLAEILDLERNKKNHYIAFQSYRPPIFSCILRNSEVLVSLSRDCDPLLEKMKIVGEIPSTSVISVSRSSTANSVRTNRSTSRAKEQQTTPTPYDLNAQMKAMQIQKKFSHTVPPRTSRAQPTQKTATKTPTNIQPIQKVSSFPPKVPIEPVQKLKPAGTPAGARFSLSPMQNGGESPKKLLNGEFDGKLEERLSLDFSRLSIKEELDEQNNRMDETSRNVQSPAKAPYCFGLNGASEKLAADFANNNTDHFFDSAHMTSMLDKNLIYTMEKFKFSRSEIGRRMKECLTASNNFE